MYGKIFESMYDGTLYGQWEALVTFQQMIVLADKNGVIDMTPPALAARTSIPLEHIEAGIQVLENPDPYSRTPGEDGKRIERLDNHRPWGWKIVNYEKYRDMASRMEKSEYDRQRYQERKKGEKKAEKVESDTIPQNSTDSTHADADADTDSTVVSNDTTGQRTPRADPVQYQAVVDLWHEMMPELPRVVALSEARRAKIRQRWKKGLDNMGEWRALFTIIRKSEFLMGRTEPGPGKTKPFIATLEWVTTEGNFLKILEKKYHDKSNRSRR